MNVPLIPSKPAEPLLDVMLRIRQDMLSRESGPYLHIARTASWVPTRPPASTLDMLL